MLEANLARRGSRGGATLAARPAAATLPARPAIAMVPLDIAVDRCKGCELCIDACPKHVLELDRAVVNGLGYHPVRLTDSQACTSCALCVRVCPDVVFTVYARARVST